jgi:hypothetical protein
MVAAQTYERFAEAVMKKLIIEIAARPVLMERSVRLAR